MNRYIVVCRSYGCDGFENRIMVETPEKILKKLESENRELVNLIPCPRGGIGRHKRLKISRPKRRGGSSPSGGTKCCAGLNTYRRCENCPDSLTRSKQSTHNRLSVGSNPTRGTKGYCCGQLNTRHECSVCPLRSELIRHGS